MKIRKGKLSPRHPPYDARIQNKNRSCAMVRLSAVDSSPPAAVTRAEEGERGKKKEGVTDTGLTMTPLGCMHEQERPQFGDNQHSAEDAVSNRNLAPEDIHPARTASASILANENRIDGEKYFPLETAEEDKNPPATTRAKNDASHGSFIYAVLESITANVGAAAGAMSRSSVSDSSGRVAPTTITTLSSSRTTTQHHDQQEQQKQLSGSTYNIDDMEAETFKASVKHKPSSQRAHESANAGEGTINFYNSAPTTGNHACTLTTVVTEDTAIDGLPG